MLFVRSCLGHHSKRRSMHACHQLHETETMLRWWVPDSLIPDARRFNKAPRAEADLVTLYWVPGYLNEGEGLRTVGVAGQHNSEVKWRETATATAAGEELGELRPRSKRETHGDTRWWKDRARESRSGNASLAACTGFTWGHFHLLKLIYTPPKKILDTPAFPCSSVMQHTLPG